MHEYLNNRVALNEITDIASFDQDRKTMLVWDFIDLIELLFKNNIKIITPKNIETKLENNTFYTFPPKDSSPLILKARINYHLYYFQSIKGLFKASPRDMEKYKKYSLEDYIEILDKEGVNVSIASAFFKPFTEKHPKFFNFGYNEKIKKYEEELMTQITAGGYLYCPRKSDTINAFKSSAAELKKYYFYDDYCYDVNSLYPYLVSYFKIPYGEPIVCKSYDRKPNHVYFYKVDIAAKGKDDCLPLMLSTVQQDLNIDKYVSSEIQKNIWLIDEELDYLLAHYEAEIKYHVILEFKIAPNNIIRDYLEPELKRKEKLSDGIVRWISKQKVNTFVGRIGYKFDKTGNHNCFMHRYIIGLGRSILCEIGTIIKRKGYNVYYCDTDSIHTNMPVEEFSKVFDFDNLKIGCFKLENHFRVARYYTFKNYTGVDYDSGEIIVKASGIAKKSEDRIRIQKEFEKGLKLIGG